MFPPSWSPGWEVGGGNLPQSDRVECNGNTQCPCPAFVDATSDYPAALTVRPPGAGWPLPIKRNDSGTGAVPCARTVGRRGYRWCTDCYLFVLDYGLLPVVWFEPLVRSSEPAGYIRTLPLCASVLGTRHNDARI
jgi:hypothetical protein